MGVPVHTVFDCQRLVTEMVLHGQGLINRAPFILHLMGLLALALMLSITTRAQGNQTATSQFGTLFFNAQSQSRILLQRRSRD